MIYTATITTAREGTEGQAVMTILPVTSGLLWMCEVDFPAGCCGLVHVRIFDGSYQVFPATPRESFRGDNVTMHFDDLYFKQAAPFEFRIETWNTDETWDHTLQIRIGMAMGRAEMSRYMPALSFENFEQLLAESIARQEAIRQLQLETALRQMTGG